MSSQLLIRDGTNRTEILSSRAGIYESWETGLVFISNLPGSEVCLFSAVSNLLQSNLTSSHLSNQRRGICWWPGGWGFKAGQTEGIIMVSWFSPAVGILPDWLRILLAVIQQVNLAQGFHSGLSIEPSHSVLTYFLYRHVSTVTDQLINKSCSHQDFLVGWQFSRVSSEKFCSIRKCCF